MRPRVLLLAALALLAPRPAGACCAMSPCPDSERWGALRLLAEGPIPRDGVLLFAGATGSARCIDALAPFVKIEVRRGEQPIAGRLELADGRGSSFLWRPDVPWEPGVHRVRVEIDNDAIGPSPEPPTEDVLDCPLDCPDPAVVLLDVDVTVGPEFSPPLPPVPAPALSLALTAFDRTMVELACCPDVAPTLTCCGDCRPTWEGSGCVALYERRALAIAAPPHAAPPELAAQILYELRADGKVIDRQFAAERLAALDRQAPACAQVIALHLGTGEAIASPVTCPSQQLVEALGVRPVDVAAALACADPVRCGTPEDTWEPAACVAYDPLALPPPPAVPSDSTLDTPCPRAQGPWLVPEAGEAPTTGEGEPASTGAGDPATAGGDSSAADGCACGPARGRGPALALLVPLLLRRRRAR